jgi:hypothetical protein
MNYFVVYGVVLPCLASSLLTALVLALNRENSFVGNV